MGRRRVAPGPITIEVGIEGNHSLPTSVLATCWAGWAEATFEDPACAIAVLEDEIDASARAVSRFYLDAGFAAVRQEEPRIELSDDRRRLSVTFVVDEGARHRIGRVEVRGPMAWSSWSIPGLREGDWFCRRRLEAGIAALRRSWERTTGKRVGVAVEVSADRRAATLDLSIVGRPERAPMLS